MKYFFAPTHATQKNKIKRDKRREGNILRVN